MTQGEKDLVLKDLSARLPYGVYVFCKLKKETPDGTTGAIFTLDSKFLDDMYNTDCSDVPFDEFMPYLRPLSSMTEEEEEDLRQKTGAKFYSFYLFGKTSCNISFPSTDEWGDEESYNETDWIKVFDWLNAHHFDYRRLIEKGVALPAPEGMYNSFNNF